MPEYLSHSPTLTAAGRERDSEPNIHTSTAKSLLTRNRLLQHESLMSLFHFR